MSEFAALLGNRPALWSRIDPRTGEKRIKPDPWRPKDPNKIVTGIEYDMSEYFAMNVVEKYCKIAGIGAQLS